MVGVGSAGKSWNICQQKSMVKRGQNAVRRVAAISAPGASPSNVTKATRPVTSFQASTAKAGQFLAQKGDWGTDGVETETGEYHCHSIAIALYTLSPIIMVQWKIGPQVVKGNEYWRYAHFPLSHDYGRKGISL